MDYVRLIAGEDLYITPPLFFYSRKHIEQYGESSILTEMTVQII